MLRRAFFAPILGFLSLAAIPGTRRDPLAAMVAEFESAWDALDSADRDSADYESVRARAWEAEARLFDFDPDSANYRRPALIHGGRLYVQADMATFSPWSGDVRRIDLHALAAA